MIAGIPPPVAGSLMLGGSGAAWYTLNAGVYL